VPNSISYRRSLEVQHADVGDELVLLDVQTGECFGFNEVAAAVWRSLTSPKSFADLRDDLLNEYDVSGEQCSAELRALLDELVEKGFVVAERGCEQQ
jgi:hypothetical protein